MNRKKRMTRPIILSTVLPVAGVLLGMQFGCSTIRSWETRPTSMSTSAEVPATEAEGSLDTVTPFRQFTITITPEPSQQLDQPSHPAVCTSEVNR